MQRELLRLEELLKQQMMDLEREKESREVQNTKDASEVLQFEKMLGLQVSAESQDVLKFIFLGNGQANANDAKSCSITLDVSNDEYNITDSTPELPQAVKRVLLEDFNVTDDIRMFLKNARFQLLSIV